MRLSLVSPKKFLARQKCSASFIQQKQETAGWLYSTVPYVRSTVIWYVYTTWTVPHIVVLLWRSYLSRDPNRFIQALPNPPTWARARLLPGTVARKVLYSTYEQLRNQSRTGNVAGACLVNFQSKSFWKTRNKLLTVRRQRRNNSKQTSKQSKERWLGLVRVSLLSAAFNRSSLAKVSGLVN